MGKISYEGDIETNFIGHILCEIYKDRIYEPYLPKKKEGTTFIDIGGFIGLTSMYFSKYFEKGYVVEPSTESFSHLIENFKDNNIDNVTPINAAVWINDGPMPFGGPATNKTMNSLHMATWDNGQAKENVNAMTFETIFTFNEIDHIDLMKLDCEGSELELLSSEGFAYVAPKIDLIVGEQHQWAGRNPHQLVEALENNGFEVEYKKNDANIFVAKKK